MNWNLNTPEGLNNAIAWTEDFLLSLGDDAVWIVPRSGIILRINRRARRVVVVLSLKPDPSIKKVFTAMGWTWDERRLD